MQLYIIVDSEDVYDIKSYWGIYITCSDGTYFTSTKMYACSSYSENLNNFYGGTKTCNIYIQCLNSVRSCYFKYSIQYGMMLLPTVSKTATICDYCVYKYRKSWITYCISDCSDFSIYDGWVVPKNYVVGQQAYYVTNNGDTCGDIIFNLPPSDWKTPTILTGLINVYGNNDCKLK